MNKAFWSHFKHFGRLLEKSYLYHTPSKSWWKSSQQARYTYNLQSDSLGSFPEDARMSRHHRPVESGHRAKLSPSVGRGGEGFRQTAHSSYLSAILQRAYYFFQIFQPKKNCLKNRCFGEQIHWVPLTFVPTQKLSGTVWTISLRFVCLFQMPMNAPRQPSVTSSMATVPIPLVPTFVPAKLVSLVMEGTVLVRRIQRCSCKNNQIPAMNLTWIEK